MSRLHFRWAITGEALVTHSVMLALLVCAAGGTLSAAEGEDDGLPISVPVQVLPSADAPPAASGEGMMIPQPQPPQPTLPDGKLPQYHMGRQQQQLDATAQPDDPRLRLLLALPTQPMLIEAVITIDGRPFRSVREQRIADLLEAAISPEPEVVQPDESASSAEATDSAEPQADENPTTGVTTSAGNAEEAAETNTAEPSDDKAEDDDSKADGDEQPEETNEDKPEPVNPPTVAAYTLATTAAEVVRRYVADADSDASPDEVRWLLTNWVDGPMLLWLNENFQRFRAAERPVFDVLDRNRDQEVSAEELQQAVASFRECDLNRDDIVDALELSRVANDPRRRIAAAAPTGTLLAPLPDADSASSIYQRLAARYPNDDATASSPVVPRFDRNANGRFDVDELQALLDSEPDVRLSVSFNTQDPASSAMAVTGLGTELAGSRTSVSQEGATITLTLPGASVMFSAVQAGESDQVAVGAVADGYPLLPHIDPNDDGRLTIRELRQLNSLLQPFDRDQDGRLTAEEVQVPIRVCFGLGPQVHRVLAGIRSAVHPQQTPAVTGPAWFVRMDRNKDNDLTRSEFPGTDEQFAALDADGDELASAQEALAYDESEAGAQKSDAGDQKTEVGD